MEEDFLTGESKKKYPVYKFVRAILILCTTMGIVICACICFFFKSKYIGICICIIYIIIVLLILLFESKDVYFTWRISKKIVDKLFARYGKVVRKQDWKNIKKKNPEAYKFIWDKKNIGHCYATAWILALWLDNAKIMYCSVIGPEGKTAHAVVVKNNCVYDTNARMHYSFEEYKELYDADVYQIFEEEVYCKKSFFDDVRQGFIAWCAERNVYCNPQ